MFGRPGDSERQIQSRFHLAARFADLAFLGQPAIVDDRAASRDLGTECHGKLAGCFDAILVFNTAAHTDDPVRQRNIDSTLSRSRFADEGCAELSELRRSLDVDEFSRAGVRDGRFRKGTRHHRDDGGKLCCRYRAQLAAIDVAFRLKHATFDGELRAISKQWTIRPQGKCRGEIKAGGVVGEEHHGGIAFAHHGLQSSEMRLGHIWREIRMGHQQDAVGGAKEGEQRSGIGPHDQRFDLSSGLACQLAGGRQKLQGNGLQHVSARVDTNQNIAHQFIPSPGRVRQAACASLRLSPLHPHLASWHRRS